MHQNHSQDFQNSEFDSIQDNTLIEGAERRKYQITADNDFKEVVLRIDSQINTECEDKKDSQKVVSFKCISERANTSNICNITNGKMIQSTSRVYNMHSSQNQNKLNYDQNSQKSHFQKIFQDNNNLNQSQQLKYLQEQSLQNIDYKAKNGNYSKVSSMQLPTLKGQASQKSVFNKSKITKLGKLQQIMLLKNMVQKLMRHVPSAMYAKLTQYHLDIIGDFSLARNERRSVKYLLANIPVLMPNHYLFDIWKIMQIIIVGYHLFRCLLLIGFENNFDIQSIRATSIVFFFIDFIFNLNAGYYDGLDIVLERKRIIKHNFVEIISSLISIFAQIYEDNEIINLIFIIRLRSLFTNISIIEQNFSLNQKYPILVTISKLLFLIILIAHTFACGFVLITKFEKEQTLYWLIKQNLLHESWQKIYLNALYFSFITMITVGYGDITPVTDIEKMYVIFFTLITCIVYAYVVNTIGTLFSEFSQKSAEFKKQRYQLLSYMNDRKISKPVQISVIKYLEYTQQQEKVLKYSKVGEQFLQTIPKSLRQEVYEDFYGRIINEVSILKRYLSKKCLSALSQIMKEQNFGPEEKVFSQGDLDYKFFFVVSGKIEIAINLNNSFNQQRVLGHLKKGQQYGIHSLFSLESRKVSAKCLENTSILIIHKEDFLAVLKEFRDDYEVYCMIKDNVTSNLEACEETCPSCLQKDHQITQCELLQYKPRKDLIIQKAIYYQDQEYRDNSFVRRGLRSNYTLKHNYFIRNQLKALRVNILNKEFNNVITKLLRKHENLQEAIKDNSYEHDEIFFNLIPEFCFYHNEIVMALDEEDLNKSSIYGSLYNQNGIQSYQNEDAMKYSNDFDKILEENLQKETLVQQNKIVTKHQKELFKLLSKQKSVQFSAINEENNSEYAPSKNQGSIVESTCSIAAQGLNIANPNNNGAGIQQPFTPLQKHNTNNSNINNTNNPSINNQKQIQSHVTPSSSLAPSSMGNLVEPPSIPLNHIINNSQSINYQQPSSTPSNAQNNYMQFEQKNSQHTFTQIQTSVKQLPLHNFQRENSLSKALPFSPNNFGQSNRNIQIPSSLGDGTPSNQKYYNLNHANSDRFQYPQFENLQIENQNNLSPPKVKPISSFDYLPNPFDQNQQLQQQALIQQQQVEEQNKVGYSQKLGQEKEKKQVQNPKFNRRDCCKMDKSQLYKNQNIEGYQNHSELQQQFEEELPQRKSRRKITVFKDNLRFSVKEKNSELMKENTLTLGQQLATSNSSDENNIKIEEEFIMKDIFVIMEFDNIKEFQYYFPQHNYSQIRFKNKNDNLPEQIQSFLYHTTNIVLKKNMKSLS